MAATRCPICRKPTESGKDADFPFCSERCRLLDLGNWASEKYRVSQPVFDESEFGSPSAPVSHTGEAEDADHHSPQSAGENHEDHEEHENHDPRGRGR